jgi:hypothetical protein
VHLCCGGAGVSLHCLLGFWYLITKEGDGSSHSAVIQDTAICGSYNCIRVSGYYFLLLPVEEVFKRKFLNWEGPFLC